jgi:CRISPR-associated endonuclease/helicase Cas3
MLEREGMDLHDPEIFREYFQRLYQDVPTDREGIQKLRKEFDYPEVASRFRLISEESIPVLVQYEGRDRKRYKDLQRLIERIRHAGLRAGDHRRLQPYVVGMLEHEFEKKRGRTEEIAEGVFLWVGGYDELRGISDVSDDPANLIV